MSGTPIAAQRVNLVFSVTLKKLSLLVATSFIAACSSIPLPIWSTQPSLNKMASAQLATAAPPTPVTPPAPSNAAITPTLPTPFTVAPSIESPEVSARFAAPSIAYSTPGLQTGRTSFSTQAEIKSWLRNQVAAAASTPGVRAAVIHIGRSQRGEDIEALVLTRALGTNPAALQSAGRPTVLLIGQQHGNEPAGSEALLVIAMELARGLLQPLLNQINVVIVPRANPDAANSEQSTIDGGLDLNRDHLLLKTPEVQALTTLKRDYRPTVVLDAHEYAAANQFLDKFGTLQKFDALFAYATTVNQPEFLTKAAEEWYRRPILAALKAQGLSTEWYYSTSNDLADKKVSMGDPHPDTARNANGLKNMISLLIETRGVGLGRLHIQRRVHTHVTAITSVLTSTAKRSAELMLLRPYIDKEVSTQACQGDAVIEAATTPTRYELAVLDPVNGSDKVVTVDWESALSLRPIKTRARPCGYWLSAESTTAVERLKLHGVQVLNVAEAGSMLGDSYREISHIECYQHNVRGESAGNNKVIKPQVRLIRAVVDVPRGSYYVSLNQPLGNLVMAALEPDTLGSYFANQLLPSLETTVRVMAPPNVKFEEVL